MTEICEICTWYDAEECEALGHHVVCTQCQELKDMYAVHESHIAQDSLNAELADMVRMLKKVRAVRRKGRALGMFFDDPSFGEYED